MRSAVALAFVAACTAAATPRVFLNIIVDDLGFANFGPRSPNPPENETPRLTSLASRGVTLTRQYNHYTCTPSRSSFNTGRLPVHVQTTLDNPDYVNAGVPQNMTTLPRKMANAGYAPVVFGKWDMGFASYNHTPAGRGYVRSLVYATHMNNYWSQAIEPTGTSCTNTSILDLWDGDGPAVGVADRGSYMDDLVLNRSLAAVADFSAGVFGTKGLFLDVRFHSMHWPLMVDEASFDAFSFVEDDEPGCGYRFYGDGMWPAGGAAARNFSCRRQYQAMLRNMDARVGAIEDALVAAGLWADTLVTFFSDNGGSIDHSENAASNFPLRGGKYSA